MKLFYILIIFLIASCSSTGVVQTGKDTYMIASKSAKPGFGPPVGAKASIYKEANAFCADNQQFVETINFEMTNAGFARPGTVSLEFRCK